MHDYNILKDNSLGKLYATIYRCEDCQAIKDPDGVYYFVNGRGKPSSPEYLSVTVPVANFGDVINSKIWVVATNPDGSDRNDPLVGLPVEKFGVNRRSLLKEKDIEEIFNLQCNYFKQPKLLWHPYFLTFVKLLDGIRVKGQPISFSSGDVCFVDAIKCPTKKAWMGFVMSADGKKVWDNCQKIKNKFLDKQIDLHQPQIILFYGTSGLIRVEKRGRKILESEVYSNKLKLTLRYLYDKANIKRVSVDFSNTRLNKLTKTEIESIRAFISKGIENLA